MTTSPIINQEYSTVLDNMTTYVSNFVQQNRNDLKIMNSVSRSAQDFCFNNTDSFKKDFFRKINVEFNQDQSGETTSSSSELYEEFLEKICSFDGECIFLLRDTFQIMKDYKEKTQQGFGIYVNRKFLCGSDEEKYFELINLIYISLSSSNNLTDFLSNYIENFKAIVENNIYFMQKAQQIYQYVLLHKKQNKIYWIDYGFQFSFSLFCYASVKYFSSENICQDFFSFTTYTWLQDFFREKYFSRKNELCLSFELQGVQAYTTEIKKKSSGCLVGFAVGDAMGAPIAGMEINDVKKMIKLPITGFISNANHPFFRTLRIGQYTDNTNLLIISTELLKEKNGFDIESYCTKLIEWYRLHEKSSISQRWLGVTAATALKKLSNGYSRNDSGSTQTESCSSTYRVVPLSIYHNVSNFVDNELLMTDVQSSAEITHKSPISVRGAQIVALIISELLNGTSPNDSINIALQCVYRNSASDKLIERINYIICNYSKLNDDEVRQAIGTGSLIYQTLPLSIYCFIKYKDNFEKAVCIAANSIRSDSEEEKKRVSKYDWEAQFIQVIGGNSDGIAALTGAFMGAYHGFDSIPDKFLTVENMNYLKTLGEKLTDL